MGLGDRAGGGSDTRTELDPPRLTTPRAAGIAGIVFAALFTTAILANRGFVSLDPAALANALTGPRSTAASLAASYLVPFAGIAFLWFIGVVRDRVGVHEDRFFATVFLGSGVLFVAMMFAAASVLSALLMVGRLTPEIAGFGRALTRSFLYVYAARSAGVFTIVTSTIILRTRAASRWVAFLGLAVGLSLLLSVAWFDLIILMFPAWVVVLSVMILVYSRAAGTTEG